MRRSDDVGDVALGGMEKEELKGLDVSVFACAPTGSSRHPGAPQVIPFVMPCQSTSQKHGLVQGPDM